MVTAVRSLGLQGISGYEVTVECFLSGGLPAFDIVGLGDTAVKESRERVRAAVKNCGVKFPVSRITVNLAPAGRKKEGTLYDLPILLGILASAEEIKPPAKDAAFVGELSLTGTLRAVNGVLPMAMAAVAGGADERDRPRLFRRHGTGKCQARAGDRRCRRTQYPAHRLARRGQIHAGAAASVDPARHDAKGSA